MEIVSSAQVLQQTVRGRDAVLFFDRERRMFVQLGPQLLAVHVLQPYPTWREFRPRIQGPLVGLVEVLQQGRELQFDRIGLRDLNRIEVPGSGGVLSRAHHYLRIYPFLDRGFPESVHAFDVSCHFSYAGGRDLCRLRLTSEPGGPALQLDIDYFLATPQHFSTSDALEWVDAAHDRVEELLEASRTNELPALFEPTL